MFIVISKMHMRQNDTFRKIVTFQCTNAFTKMILLKGKKIFGTISLSFPFERERTDNEKAFLHVHN